MSRSARLVGDGVENPANATALLDAAAMFAVPCLFRNAGGRAGRPLPTVDTAELLDGRAPIVAVENAPGAASVFTAELPAGRAAIVVGNERRGIRPDLLRAATRCVQIPMSGRGVNTLNVASAAAVALYYLLAPRRPRPARARRYRPDVLLLGPGDHVEAGSALRSAAAFGWRSVGLDDRDKVWFGTPRAVRAEGRAAARSHRNPLRVVPVPAGPDLDYARVVVAGPGLDGPPLHRVDLAGRPGTLLVVPDGAAWPDSANVETARVELPGPPGPHRYRLVASIVLAEVARQLGTRGEPARQRFPFESALAVAEPDGVDLVGAGELLGF